MTSMMKIIAGGRQSGKTTRMIEWFLNGNIVPGYHRPVWNRVIIVHTRDMMYNVHRSIVEYHLASRLGTTWNVPMDQIEYDDITKGPRMGHHLNYGGVTIAQLLTNVIAVQDLDHPSRWRGRFIDGQEFGIDEMDRVSNYWLSEFRYSHRVVLATWNGHLEVENI